LSSLPSLDIFMAPQHASLASLASTAGRLNDERFDVQLSWKIVPLSESDFGVSASN
ncbi:18043_t:CDS:2, partial [Gigaspora rosea]